MSSLDDLIVTLRGAVDHLHQAVTHARTARDMAEENQVRSEALGAHGVAGRFAGIVDQAEQLLATLTAGIDAGERLIAQVEAAKHGGTAGGVAPVPVVPAGGNVVPAGGNVVPAPTRPAPPTMPNLTFGNLGEVVDRLPSRERDKGPTSGCVFDEAGNPIGTHIRSHRQPEVLHDLDLPYPASHSEAMVSHVEVKVAALMRRGEAPQHTTVVINNRSGPCGWLERRRGEPPTGLTCDEWLDDILPAGSTLTIRWRDPDGWGRREIYHGTGRRIRP